MADISKLTALDGVTYDIKDAALRERCGSWPIASRTYENVIASANTQAGAGFFYLKVRGSTYDSVWRVKVAVHAVVPSNADYNTHTVYEVWGSRNTVRRYACSNTSIIESNCTIRYNSCFLVSLTGYDNGCGSWIGFSLQDSASPTSASLKRSVTVELLSYENCAVELQDALIKPGDIPGRAAHTNWYTSTEGSYQNYDAKTQGYIVTGDQNTTNIKNLHFGNASYIANSAVYRYQLLFQTDENTLTPLNNANNSTATNKTMLTSRKFDPFGKILYYASTTNVNSGASIGGGNLQYAYGAIDLRYTFNCGTTLTANKPFYLVVVPQSDGNCVIDGSSPWAQTLPTTNDGKWYILIGRMISSTYQSTLHPNHPVYYHDGTAVRLAWPQQPPVSAITNAEIDAILAG